MYGFLKYFGRSSNPYNPFNTGNVNSHKREVYEKTFESCGFLKYFWVKVDHHSTVKVCENTNTSNLWVS